MTTRPCLGIASIVPLLVYVLANVPPTHAGDVIETPSGLRPGDQFRVVFVTDQTFTGESTSIAVYNADVNMDAAAEVAGSGQSLTYSGIPVTFTAIASTPSTSAISNIGAYNVPIFLNGGPEVAPSSTSTGLWSGSSISNGIEFSLTGIGEGGDDVWTGTSPAGLQAAALGTTFPTFGQTQNGAPGGWTDAGTAPNTDGLLRLYGISQVLTVPGSSVVPEPGAIALVLTGLISSFGYAKFRKRVHRISELASSHR